MDLVIAGPDMVTVDTAGSALMGIDPSEVRNLGLAEKMGLRISKFRDIDMLGEETEAVKTGIRASLEIPERKSILNG